ncbi:MAG: ferredoxin-NADP reductase [Candidatus Omnitrophica bacterium 4484_70.2]|nr:MAG: ferredoxin-NADP reductase [Candidatus Omnitrophica bacterium 4484_70.2]
MRSILKKEILVSFSPRIIKLKVEANFTSSPLPSQFVILMVSPYGERIPLTIVEKEGNAITLIFQEVGFTTQLLGSLKEGDSLYSLIGPLGNPFRAQKYGKVVVIGGGVGVAEMFPVVKALKKEGNYVISILGARSKKFLILEEEIRSNSDKVFISTDDGSKGEKGFTTQILERLLKKERIDLVYSVGPLLMMKKTSEITKLYQVKTIVSLNPIMVDGTGMCGSCRVIVGGKVHFACVDGPDFDAHLVDFDDLLKRNSRFVEEEKKILNEKNPFISKEGNF